MEPWIPITVAVIAAIVSLIAALASHRQATNARNSAEKLDSRAHRIARIDREVEELRESFKGLMTIFGNYSDPEYTSKCMALLEMLIASQGATADLEKAAQKLLGEMAMARFRPTPAGLDPTELRAAYKQAQKALADKRQQEATDK
ncbi:hypothetical protein GCM10027417_24120 [Glutamicibacter endophyticus]